MTKLTQKRGGNMFLSFHPICLSQLFGSTLASNSNNADARFCSHCLYHVQKNARTNKPEYWPDHQH